MKIHFKLKIDNFKFSDLLWQVSPLYKFRISGESMLPTFKNGTVIVVNRLAYLFRNPKKGDIIGVKDPRDGKILIKRIAKIEGKKYCVLGDNLHHSTDSREFGMIERGAIVGKVMPVISKP